MNDDQERTDAPWDEFDLHIGEALRVPTPSASLRASVLAETSVGVRRFARRRQARRAFTLAVAYAAGVVTMVAAKFAPVEPREPETVPEPVAMVVAPPAPAAVPNPIDDPEGFGLLLARVTPDEQCDLLKAAGDRYLNEYGDVARALGCYRRLLDSAPTDRRRRPEPSDSWLLMTLKRDRMDKENLNENRRS